MPASIFISHVYEDMKARDALKNWVDKEILGPGFVVTGESEDLRHRGPGAIRNHLSPLLRGAAVVLVLVGRDTHNHQWIDYEVNHARSERKKVVAVRIPGTSGAPPKSLAGIEVLEMEPSLIGRALRS